MNDKNDYIYIIDAYEWYFKFFEEAKNRCIPTFINGVFAPYNKIEILCLVLLKDSYMYDYVSDEKGKIVSICLERVTAC